MHACSVASVMSDSAILRTVALQAPLSMGILYVKTGMTCHFLLQGSFRSRERTCISYVSCIGRWVLYHLSTWEEHIHIYISFSHL